MAKDSDHAVSHEGESRRVQFSHTWQDMPDEDIADQYILEAGDPDHIFTDSAMDAFDRLRERRGEGRFARCTQRMDGPDHPSHAWAGRGFNRRDGESTT